MSHIETLPLHGGRLSVHVVSTSVQLDMEQNYVTVTLCMPVAIHSIHAVV